MTGDGWGSFIGSISIALGMVSACGVGVDDSTGALSGGSSPASGTPAEDSSGESGSTGESSASMATSNPGTDGGETGADAGDDGGSDTGTVDCEEQGVAYRDQDGDGFGDPDQPTAQCPPPPGYVLDFSDCNDTDETINPDAEEICDQVDQDCDGLIDEVSPVNTSCDGCELRDIMGRPFWFCPGAQTFNGAEAICAAKGAHLASIHNVTEQSMSRMTASMLSGSDWWIGFTDGASEGTFAWVDGSAATYTNWESGEPNDHRGGEDCAEMKDGDNGVWNDVPCEESKSFLCSVAPMQ